MERILILTIPQRWNEIFANHWETLTVWNLLPAVLMESESSESREAGAIEAVQEETTTPACTGFSYYKGHLSLQVPL